MSVGECPFAHVRDPEEKHPGELFDAYLDNNLDLLPATSPHKDDGYEPTLQENVPAFKALRDIFDPLSVTAKERLTAEFEANSAALHERAEKLYVGQLSYPPEYAILPPGFFGNDMVAPFSDTESLTAQVKRYAETHLEQGTPAEQAILGRYGGRSDRDPIWDYGALNDTLRSDFIYGRLKHTDWAQWATYEATYTAERAAGREANLLSLWQYRKREIDKHISYSGHTTTFDYADGAFDTFLFARAETNAPEYVGLPEMVVMPVGEYGLAFAEKLLKATTLVIENLDTMVDAEAAECAAQYSEVLSVHSARGRTEMTETGGMTAATPKATLQEGILSVMQAIALLTANKVEGYDDPDKLLNDIIDSGVVERFTRKVTMGVVGPYALKGVYFKNPLQVVDGQLDFSEPLLRVLDERKAKDKEYALEELANRHHYELSYPDANDFIQNVLGIMCPAASENGGVRNLADTLKTTYTLLPTNS